MRIGEASRISGASPRSLRHYEDEGLIVPGRLHNGYRDYCPSTVDRVLAIRSLLESGLPVRLIRELLTGPRRGHDDVAAWVGCSEVLGEVRAYRDRLTDRIDELHSRRSAIDAFLRRAEPTDR